MSVTMPVTVAVSMLVSVAVTVIVAVYVPVAEFDRVCDKKFNVSIVVSLMSVTL